MIVFILEIGYNKYIHYFTVRKGPEERNSHTPHTSTECSASKQHSPCPQ